MHLHTAIFLFIDPCNNSIILVCPIPTSNCKRYFLAICFPYLKNIFFFHSNHEKFLNYRIAQRMLRPKPPSNTNHPIAFPPRIKIPPIIIPAAGPVPALKLETIRLTPPMIIIGFAVYLFLINVNTVKTVY